MAASTEVGTRRAAPPSLRLEDESASPARPTKGPYLSIIVPLFNEEATVAALYDEIDSALCAGGLEWEVVYVDDGSTHGSYRELVRLHAAKTNVRVVRLRRNFGKAAGLAAGIEASSGEVI